MSDCTSYIMRMSFCMGVEECGVVRGHMCVLINVITAVNGQCVL